MKILVAEYASAIGLGGTCELEGRAMLSTLVESFEKSGHNVTYATHGPKSTSAGDYILVNNQPEFEAMLENVNVDACLLIAPDGVQPRFLEIIEDHTANLGSSPAAAGDGCRQEALHSGARTRWRPCGRDRGQARSRGEGLSSLRCEASHRLRLGGSADNLVLRAGPGEIVTRYHEGLRLSASFIVGREGLLPLTINRQLINFEGEGISYQGSQVPYNTPRADEIWAEAKKAAVALGLRGYAGIDFVLGERPWAVDVNARPTTSIIGIARVMKRRDRGADTASEIWRDADGGACGWGVHVPEGGARMRRVRCGRMKGIEQL